MRLRQIVQEKECAVDVFSLRGDLKLLLAAHDAQAKQVSHIEDFLWGRKYCTELYISPLGFSGCESWQVEVNYGDKTEAFQGDSVADALAQAVIACMKRKADSPHTPPTPQAQEGERREQA